MRDHTLISKKKATSIRQYIDAVIIAEEPKLAPFKNRIKENLSKIMNMESDCVSIKAKTNEGLDSLGRKEGIACYATVLIKKEN